MVQLNSQDKVILASLLLEVINADGIISDNEMRYYSWVQSNFDLSPSDFQRGQDYDPNLGVSILRDMPDEKKATFCKIIQTMGNIDRSPFEATKEAVERSIVKARLLGSLKKFPNPF